MCKNHEKFNLFTVASFIKGMIKKNELAFFIGALFYSIVMCLTWCRCFNGGIRDDEPFSTIGCAIGGKSVYEVLNYPFCGGPLSYLVWIFLGGMAGIYMKKSFRYIKITFLDLLSLINKDFVYPFFPNSKREKTSNEVYNLGECIYRGCFIVCIFSLFTPVLNIIFFILAYAVTYIRDSGIAFPFQSPAKDLYWIIPLYFISALFSGILYGWLYFIWIKESDNEFEETLKPE